ncbi:hypothetical protein CLU83_3130 [Flavobacterium sp. 1]|nr:hypothetical protein CLU83_3130 [Flavobacterium sp. 1]
MIHDRGVIHQIGCTIFKKMKAFPIKEGVPLFLLLFPIISLRLRQPKNFLGEFDST